MMRWRMRDGSTGSGAEIEFKAFADGVHLKKAVFGC